MPSITPEDAAIIDVTGGVDTHQDTHTAAVIDMVGRVLGSQQFPATAAGYAALLAWMRGEFAPDRSFAQLDAEAAPLDPGAERPGSAAAGYFFCMRRCLACSAAELEG